MCNRELYAFWIAASGLPLIPGSHEMFDHEAQGEHVNETAHYELGYVGSTKACCCKGPAVIHSKMEMVYPRSNLFRYRKQYYSWAGSPNPHVTYHGCTRNPLPAQFIALWREMTYKQLKEEEKAKLDFWTGQLDIGYNQRMDGSCNEATFINSLEKQ